MSTIDLVRVSKRYGATVAAADVNLHVVQSELVTILGPSGSGKTTVALTVAERTPDCPLSHFVVRLV